jgi:hypothetical protein
MVASRTELAQAPCFSGGSVVNAGCPKSKKTDEQMVAAEGFIGGRLKLACLLCLAAGCIGGAGPSGAFEEIGNADGGQLGGMARAYVYFSGGVAPAAGSTVVLSQTAAAQWVVLASGAADHGGGVLVRTLKLKEGQALADGGGSRGSGGTWEERAPAPTLASDVEHSLGYDALVRAIGGQQRCAEPGQGEAASAAQCSAHEVLYRRAYADVRHYVEAGVKPTVRQLFDAVVEKSGAMGSSSDVVFVQVVDNKLYCVRMPEVSAYMTPTGAQNGIGGDAGSHACFPSGEDHSRDWGVLWLLEKTLRAHKVPDVAFAFHSADGPRHFKRDVGSRPHLVMLSMAKTDNYADIVFPGHSFSESSYNTFWEDWHRPDFQRGVLDQRYAWDNKKARLFWRGCDTSCDIAFSLGDDVLSSRHAEAEGWADKTEWTDILEHKRPLDLRNMHADATDRYPDVLDMRITDGGNASYPYAKKVPMMEHAAFRYLAHLDGATYSSRFMKLLLMNSAVFKMHSYVYEFFYDALIPDEHYVSFKFRFGADNPIADLIAKVKWAEANQDRVRQIAANGRKFALQHLTTDAAMCYWRELLVQIADQLLSGGASELLPGAEPFDVKTSCPRCWASDQATRTTYGKANLVPET